MVKIGFFKHINLVDNQQICFNLWSLSWDVSCFVISDLRDFVISDFRDFMISDLRDFLISDSFSDYEIRDL